ncbi:MAG: FAD-binding oxidoreductase, partial [Ornithinimicrobium sp.]
MTVLEPATARELRANVRGRVQTDALGQALYAVDASNYRVVPQAVVVPLDQEDLLTTLAVCRQSGTPTVLRAGGTSMAGNAIGGVVIDVSRHLNAILDLDPVARTAVVQPGVVLTDLMAAGRRHGLTFGADPSSASRATLGGMIANNACGAHSVAWGTTADNVLGLEVVTGDGRRLSLASSGPEQSAGTQISGPEGPLLRRLGEIGHQHERLISRRFGTFSRQISGYAVQHLIGDRGVDAARLLAGSEGTLATTLEATVSLVDLPDATVLLALGFPDAPSAADSVPIVLPHHPLTMESINATLVDRLPHDVRRAAISAGLPAGRVWLLVEVPAESTEAAGAAAARIAEEVRDGIQGATASVVTDRAAQAVLWR